MGHPRIRQTTQSGVMLETNEEMLNTWKGTEQADFTTEEIILLSQMMMRKSNKKGRKVSLWLTTRTVMSQDISNLFNRGLGMRGKKINNPVLLLTIYYFFLPKQNFNLPRCCFNLPKQNI